LKIQIQNINQNNMTFKSKLEKKIRIMLVEDHMLMRMGLVSATRIEPDMVVVAEAEDGRQALEYFHKHKPDVTIVDLRLPGMDGIELIKVLQKESPGAKTLVLTSYSGGDDVSRAIKSGASGYVTKNMPLQRVLEAVRVVYSGGQYIPSEIAGRLSERIHSELSARELEVLRLISKGRSNKEIASVLGIVEGTVKAHLTNIFSKIGAEDRTQAITIAIKRQILQLE
jgi:DNA-binding NarL/FixJ family response regulator